MHLFGIIFSMYSIKLSEGKGLLLAKRCFSRRFSTKRVSYPFTTPTLCDMFFSVTDLVWDILRIPLALILVELPLAVFLSSTRILFMLIFHQKYTRIFTFRLYINYGTQGGFTILCLYPWAHLDNTTQQIPWYLKVIGHMIYATLPKDIHRYPGPLAT